MTNSEKERTLQVRRVLGAPRERVFALWTDPEAVKHWFGGEGTKVEQVEIDLRVGGAYSIRVKEEEGYSLVSGEFLYVEAPERLVYTWSMQGPVMQTEETVVRVAFRDHGEGTEVLLTHGPFADPQTQQAHQQGWQVCFEALEARL